MSKIELDIVCKSCDGTGLYVGMSERDGAAVVCSTCKGTGCQKYKTEYELFQSRDIRDDIKRVYSTSAGYVHTAEDIEVDGKLIEFSKGGASYDEWLAGAELKPIKNLYCPLQFTGQMWKSPVHCRDNFFGGFIANCPCRDKMAECWDYYENENQ